MSDKPMTHTASYMVAPGQVGHSVYRQSPNRMKIRRTGKFWRNSYDDKFDPVTGWQKQNKGGFGPRPVQLIIESIRPIEP